jgi:tetratricopeptide (TPR) repeat protein
MEDAVRHYEEAARVRPEDYQALLLVQGPLHALGRHDEAKAALSRGLQVAERHLELNPDDARALTLGAAALIQLGERERALDWAGRAYAKVDMPDRARETWNQLIAKFPKSEQAQDAKDAMARLPAPAPSRTAPSAAPAPPRPSRRPGAP